MINPWSKLTGTAETTSPGIVKTQQKLLQEQDTHMKVVEVGGEWWKRVVVTFTKDLQQKRLQKQDTQEEKVGMETEDHRRL
jgi:hypothetical protein